MPPKDPCTEHGERLARLEEHIKIQSAQLAMLEAEMKHVYQVLNRANGAYLIAMALLAFGGTILGNVVSAKLVASMAAPAAITSPVR
jgi:hypothetical protein